MALSVLQKPPSFSDLQNFFDPCALQRSTQALIADLAQLNNVDPMEYNTSNNLNSSNNNNSSNVSQQYLTNGGHLINVGNTNSNNNTNNNNNNNNSNNNNGIVLHNSFVNENINQQLNNTNRTYISGYHHHHLTHDYEQVINFVDSPPNSEGSWTDEQPKGSPGPQIIEVQTIFSNSGARKRRMDWDSLDISQAGNAQQHNTNGTAQQQNSSVAHKIPHLSSNSNVEQQSNNSVQQQQQQQQQQNDKEKHKKEKHMGRASWTDDIDFDLNTEFNSSSYLNNESFLSFSPALTVLKQEPQTEQLKDIKSPVTCIPKSNKLELVDEANKVSSASAKTKSDLNDSGCACNSPQSSQTGFEPNLIADKVNHIVAGNDNCGGGGSGDIANADKNSRNSPVIQQTEKVAATSLSDDHKFQYILAAATSIATKNNEDTLTYLNQGQSYEIKLKKIGDLSFYRDKILKSVIKISFHERRLQYMEREQMQQWQASRPGERIIEVDVPLSYGLCHVSQPLSSNYLNTVEVYWDPLKEVGVYIKVNCISTEFTPKKHGGEKGVPFRLQIETYIESTNCSSNLNSANTPNASPLSTNAPVSGTGGGGNSGLANSCKQAVHAAACQIKVFKLKGADRKHKQDREKIQKRPQSEQEKFQPSYECTIMNDISLDLITPTTTGCLSPEYMKVWPNSPVHIPKYDGVVLPFANQSPAPNSSPIAINSVTSSNSPTLKVMDANMVSPPQLSVDMDEYTMNIMPDATPAQVAQWLTFHRLNAYCSTFAHFSGSDIMRMSKDDLIQICGLADGIRMFNILRAKVIAPRLTIYVSMDGSSYNAIYLLSNTSKELTQKIFKLSGFYEFVANSAASNMNGNGGMENGGGGSSGLYNSWSMHSKYSGSGSNIFNDVCKSAVYVTGPSGVHVTVTDEVLNNEIKDGSLYALEVQNGKVIMKLISKNDN